VAPYGTNVRYGPLDQVSLASLDEAVMILVVLTPALDSAFQPTAGKSPADLWDLPLREAV
jgi:hypothetical protein